jgi:hypothetical protein
MRIAVIAALVAAAGTAQAAPTKAKRPVPAKTAKKRPPAQSAPRTAVIGDRAVAASVLRGLGKKIDVVNVGRPDTGVDPSRLAAAHRLAVVIVCASGGTARAPTAKVTVYGGASGDVIAIVDAKGPAGQAGGKIATELWKKHGRAMVAAPQAREAEPEREPEPEPTVAAAPERKRDGDKRPAASASASAKVELGVSAEGRPAARGSRLTIAVEERPFWRRLRYKDDLDSVLRTSDLVANAVGITASVAPLAKQPALLVEGHVEFGIGINGSRTSDGQTFGTSASEGFLGASYRRRFGTIAASAALSYGQQSFAVDDDELMAELIPDVSYSFVRLAVNGSRPITKRWTANASAGYRKLLGTGDLEDAEWFPRSTGSGVEAAAGVEVGLTKRIRGYARLDVRRYFFALNPEPGDPFVAGGMTDDYFGAAVGAAMAW